MSRNYYQIKNMYSLLKNPTKYLAEDKVITARSSWEIQFIMKFLDVHSSVIGWSSEDFHIKYLYDVDQQYHRYFPDFLIKVKTTTNEIIEQLIEIKPLIETKPPKIPKKMTKSYMEAKNTYIKNTNKWTAAEKYCENQRNNGRKIFFHIITEKQFPFK